MVQPLIQPMVKKKRMTAYFSNGKMDEEQPCEEDLDMEVFSINTHFVNYDKYGSGNVSSFDQIKSCLLDSRSQVFSKMSDLVSMFHITKGWIQVQQLWRRIVQCLVVIKPICMK